MPLGPGWVGWVGTPWGEVVAGARARAAASGLFRVVARPFSDPQLFIPSVQYRDGTLEKLVGAVCCREIACVSETFCT